MQINGVEHTMLLSEEDAKRQSAVAVALADVKAAAEPANKARGAKNKS